MKKAKIAIGDGRSRPTSTWIVVQRIRRGNIPIPRKENDRRDFRVIKKNRVKDPAFLPAEEAQHRPRDIGRVAKELTITKTKLKNLPRIIVPLRGIKRNLKANALVKMAIKNLGKSIKNIKSR